MNLHLQAGESVNCYFNVIRFCVLFSMQSRTALSAKCENQAFLNLSIDDDGYFR